jgi:SnoaL-like protein
VSSECAVLSLLGRYCRAMDGADVEALLDCFTPDGVFRYFAPGADEPMLDYAGRAELSGWFAEHRAGTPIGSQTHVTVNASVALSGLEGRADSTYLSVREAAGGGIAITATGTYADRIVRGEDGQWRLAERTCRAFMPRPPQPEN